MPYHGRQFAPSFGTPPEFQHKPPLPVPPSPAGLRERVEDREDARMMSRISLRDFTVPPEKIYAQLFGKEVKVDEYTRGLVPEKGRPA